MTILLTGAGGNFINALLYKSNHISVGSSTAVFGAVGILAGYQFLKKFRLSGRGAKAWLPLGAGLALLAFLGSSKYADITAHLFGFLVGIVAGVSYGFLVKQPAGRLLQASCVVLTMIVIITAWLSAYHLL